MGLDISFYERLVPTDAPDDGEDGYPDKFQPYINPHFPGRAEGIVPDVWYEDKKAGSFRAGSYSGYSFWRSWLASESGGAFEELINFSDCEGTIGPAVSAKLAKDFADNRERILTDADEWNAVLYDRFAEAFRVASNAGCVCFH